MADIGFIVDSSGSLKREYSKEKDFVKSVADTVGISEKGSHVGVVLFSYFAELRIKFTDFSSAGDFKKAVDGLPLMKSTTRIDRALMTAYNEMFNERNGMRVTVPKILVLLTDGEQTKGGDAIPPEQVVQKFHDADIKVIVIGIGAKVKPAELKALVKSKEDLYLAKDFEQLKSGDFVDRISGSTCLQTGRRCLDRSLVDIGIYWQILSDIGRHWETLGDIVRYCQILSDIARYCQILPPCHPPSVGQFFGMSGLLMLPFPYPYR